MRKELLTYKDPKSPVSEVFRTLRTNIQFMNTNKKLKTLLVTSTFPGEGKSWTASNLAVTFAQAGKRVILVDADMRKGRQYNIFGVLPKPGLSNYLSNMDAENNETTDINIAQYIQETDVENLHILVAGNVPPNPSELLVSSEMRHLLNELKEMCDLVIIDGTPCDLVTDSIILSRIVDSTIIVTAQKETKKDSLTRIVKNIKNVGGKIAGVVVNKVDVSAKKFNQSYYYGSISGNSMTTHSKNRRKVDNIVTNLSQFTQDEEDELLNSEEKYFENDTEKDNEILEEIKNIINEDNSEKIYQESQETVQVISENVEEPEREIVQVSDEQAQNPQEVNWQEQNLQEINEQEINAQEQNQQEVNEQEINQQEINQQEANEQEINSQEQEINQAEMIERAESAKNISEEKAQEIINIVNSYIKSEKNKQKRGSTEK